MVSSEPFMPISQYILEKYTYTIILGGKLKLNPQSLCQAGVLQSERNAQLLHCFEQISDCW